MYHPVYLHQQHCYWLVDDFISPHYECLSLQGRLFAKHHLARTGTLARAPALTPLSPE